MSAISSSQSGLHDLLTRHGIVGPRLIAHRIQLDPADTCEETPDTGALIARDEALFYERMQDGLLFGPEARVLSFVDDGEGRVCLVAFRLFKARRPGTVPGDIVYDYDRAHLLHNFIARAKEPCFYDAFDESGLEDVIGRWRFVWPVDTDLLALSEFQA